MSSAVIRVEDLGKQYHLGQVGTGTISHDFNRWWHKVRGKEDPYLKVGEINDRTKKGESDLIWALKNINFEIKKGEAVGIIGRNGAGKSTLLKVLSRVTGPTVGDIKVKGRIAALLEVGTGFHPDLTGKENIFLNGAILGMSKQEIKNKFDEIVDFSGVERYIDTPIKRYSSGMYVRLAFAVAAHLESEILIVDEVLAVGDAEFQKKCLGKMSEVTGKEGRTVLFVSHDMAAVRSLVNNCILLENGSVSMQSTNVHSLINEYLFGKNQGNKTNWASEKIGNEYIDHLSSEIKNESNITTSEFDNEENIYIEVKIKVKIPSESLVVAFTLKNGSEQQLMRAYFDDFKPGLKLDKGTYKIVFKIPRYTLAFGEYKICFDVAIHNYQKISVDDSDLYFKVKAKSDMGNKFNFIESSIATSIIRPDICHDIILLEG